MTTVALIATLDTKGIECEWLRDRVYEHGADVLLVDTGVLGEPRLKPDITREEVAGAGGTTIETLRAEESRNVAVAAMARGAAEIVTRLHGSGRLHAVLSLGGSCGSTIATEAMRALPIGVPKLMVSTMAAGDVSRYVGGLDVIMMHSVVDIAGVNRVSAPILANAAAAITAMAAARPSRTVAAGERPQIGATMFGVTTAGGDACRERLSEFGYEVLVFHANGAGGRSLETVAANGLLAGVLDLTTTELADDLVGGVFSAGPRRLEAAGRCGLPQVVSLGALDMVNFGSPDTVPERFRDRRPHVHNSNVTVVRTTPGECAELGRRVARKLRAATGPAAVYVPLRGLSAYGVCGAPLHDPEADQALFAALREGLCGSAVELREIDTHINDPGFARAMADRLHELIAERVRTAG